MHNGEIVLGVSSGTMMEELAWAEKGVGAFVNGERVQVSRIDDPGSAAVSTGNLKSLAKSAGWDIQQSASRRERHAKPAERVKGAYLRYYDVTYTLHLFHLSLCTWVL